MSEGSSIDLIKKVWNRTEMEITWTAGKAFFLAAKE
jgi:hypothetical protein